MTLRRTAVNWTSGLGQSYEDMSNGLPYAIGLLSVLSVLSCLSVCDVGVLWPNGSMDQDDTWRAGRPRL